MMHSLAMSTIPGNIVDRGLWIEWYCNLFGNIVTSELGELGMGTLGVIGLDLKVEIKNGDLCFGEW